MSRILIVDDNAQNLYFLKALLQGNGHEVVQAANGAEALALARGEPPDLIVSDILMPVMDGFTLCRLWKSDERLKTIPFIVYTATYTERKDEELALSLGAARFVIKPQDPVELMRIIAEVLAGHPGVKGAPETELKQENFLQDYNEVLFHKLVKKMEQLEKTNREMQITLAERARVEAALWTSETKYRIVADNTRDWEFWTDPDGRFIYSSPSCLRVTGHDAEEFMKNPGLVESIVHPDDLAAFRAHADRTGKIKGPTSFDFRIIHADGGVRWLAQECSPVFDEKGVYLGSRGSNRDMTEHKCLEEQLRHSQKLETVGRLAGGVAHDFNNLLTAIIGFTNLSQMKMAKDDPLRGNLDQILTAAERAAVLTGSLLAFSRKREMKLETVDLNDLSAKMEKLLRRTIGEEIRLETDLREGTIWICADRGQIEQVLMNLVANARDAMPGGGVLSIATDTLDLDEEFVRRHGLGVPGRYAVLSVSDNGVGMDEQTRKKVFEPFFTTKEVGKGTGLGLSIVYGIVQQHNAFITIDSQPGQGTTCKIFLPLATRKDSAQGTSATQPLRGGSETILVVDDEAAVRGFIETFLTGLGYHVILGANGQEAVDRFREEKDVTDLVILDVIMPGKSGKEAAEEIRRLRPQIGILFMSGYPADLNHNKGGVEEGAELLMKPLTPSGLAGKVREILDRSGKRSGLT